MDPGTCKEVAAIDIDQPAEEPKGAAAFAELMIAELTREQGATRRIAELFVAGFERAFVRYLH